MILMDELHVFTVILDDMDTLDILNRPAIVGLVIPLQFNSGRFDFVRSREMLARIFNFKEIGR